MVNPLPEFKDVEQMKSYLSWIKASIRVYERQRDNLNNAAIELSKQATELESLIEQASKNETL